MSGIVPLGNAATSVSSRFNLVSLAPSALLATAERLDGAVVLLLTKAETIENLLDAVIDVVGVVVMQQFVEAVVARGQGGMLGGIGGVCELFRRVDQVVMRGDQLVETALGFREQRASRVKIGILAQDRGSRAGMKAHVARIWLIEAGKNAQESRLARAVGADQADALAGL